MQTFDVVVIGGGHAGCEAALAACRVGARVGLITLSVDRIGQMSCNPAIGGVGKGQLVREVDALGGAMGEAIDATGIQFRRLNTSRGPAVRSTRAQADSARYRAYMRERVSGCDGLQVLQDEAVGLETRGGRVDVVRMGSGGTLRAGAVVVTTGTFLNGVCHVGSQTFAGGRVNDPPSVHLSGALRSLGISLRRFKTGTTPRLAGSSIRWDELAVQPGDEPRPRFSFEPVRNTLRQICCHITATNDETHRLIRDNLHRSALYSGRIEGRGPRYCPSIDEKVKRFADREHHQVFLEPEGLDTEWVYPNGLSTSLPVEVQTAFLRTMAGLQDVRVVQHGYAVEYDYAPPTQVSAALMAKSVEGLFLAGQINGTSGYEEAAAQGLMAGLNAARHVAGSEPAVLGRNEAYVGVLIDDLVTRGVDEPYRMFTSRAEHRLTLRESNAEERLWRRARQWGLLSAARMLAAQRREAERERLRRLLDETRVGAILAAQLGLPAEQFAGVRLREALRRSAIGIDALLPAGSELAEQEARVLVEEEIKYEGYIRREARAIEKMVELDNVALGDVDRFHAISGLSTELQQKLAAVRPVTLGQASRIPGMTPSALMLLRVRAAGAARRGLGAVPQDVSRET